MRILFLLLLAAASGCAATVPLEQHQALESRIGELRAGQEVLRTELDALQDANQQLTAMVAAQRMIIRDLRCRPSITIEAE
ncbi:MAG: hypothetical protein GY723_07520 [bacterium]|nr:hypothetical protein [bacterium]MCP5068797.1 hypothetical protein [bacterium]